MKYRKKPVVIEAYQTDKELDIETLEGTMHASVGDYIITGVRGEKYPCKPDIFEQTYEPADTPASPWHRVEEELPEKNGAYLVFIGYGDNWIWFKDIYKDGKFMADTCALNGARVTHWMPIEPPREE